MKTRAHFGTLVGLLASSAMAALALSWAPPAVAQGPGPTTVFIKYRAEPWNRPAFRKHMASAGLRQFEQWKREGALQDYVFLHNLYLDRDTWDAMAVIELAGVSQFQKWKDIERRSPGGLSKEALALAWPTSTEFADRTWSGTKGARDLGKAYYIVIEYDYSEPEAFRAYGKVFLDQQVKEWMNRGALSRYDVWLNQYPALKPCEEPSRACPDQTSVWDCIMIWEYKDLPALAWRDVTKWQTRAELKDPAFNVIVARPRSYRIEYNTVVARAIVPETK